MHRQAAAKYISPTSKINSQPSLDWRILEFSLIARVKLGYSQSEGIQLHQSKMQMSRIRAVNLEGFKNIRCLDLELASMSTLMLSSEKQQSVLRGEDVRSIFLNDTIRSVFFFLE